MSDWVIDWDDGRSADGDYGLRDEGEMEGRVKDRGCG